MPKFQRIAITSAHRDLVVARFRRSFTPLVQTVGPYLGRGLRDMPMTDRSQKAEANSVSRQKYAGGSVRMR